ncbi:MAG TPA: OmpA family protein [Sphingobacterium sp.]|nr:OmpA family protein [Sphingobacterium sp.]
MKYILISTFALLVSTQVAAAQILDRVIDRTKDKARNRTEGKADETIDKGLDKIEEGIGNIFKKKDKKETKPKSSSKKKTSASGDDTDFSEYEGSAFVPGKNVLFFEDFVTARLGTGNANWYLNEIDAYDEVERPSVKAIPTTSGNWLKMPRKGFVFPNSFKNLPEQFTLEFDLYADPNKMNEHEGGFRANFIALDNRKEYNMYWPGEPAIGLDIHPHGTTEVIILSAITEYNSNLTREEMVLFEKTFKSGWNPGAVNRTSIYRNGKHVILYLNGKEMFNLPNGLPKKAQYNLIFSANMWGDGMYVSNIRIAGNVPNATEDIKSEGKFVTNAIYFDVNSSRIKPESWATLKQAADAIKSATDNILIVGHTDSDGADDANLKLSQSRAASVKRALVNEFGIDTNRLTTDGKGESVPLNKNITPAEKAQNRRVEFIKK